jgi:D-alanyl-lipoteichoic acid acyltransferase DltB (MBOAT superfamily)
MVLNAYFQFAGYSDIAIGIALLLGFRVMEKL